MTEKTSELDLVKHYARWFAGLVTHVEEGHITKLSELKRSAEDLLRLIKGDMKYYE